jgi:DNA-binding NarL/FixJ family response regulator
MNIRVAIAEDAVLFRAGLCRLIEDHGHQVCAAVGDGEELLAAVAEHRPDVVVADIRMPPTHTDEGLRAALMVTGGTVEKHVASIFDKLRLPPGEADNRRVLAVLRYLGS